MDKKDLKDKFTVYVFCDSSVTADEREMLVKAMQDTAPVYGCYFYFGEDVPGESGNAERILSKASVNPNGQLNASDILNGMVNAYKSRRIKGAMVIFTAKDLYLKKTWCFGAARVGGGVSVQSMARFRDLDPSDKQLVITRTLRHELGHIHRCAADPGRANTESKYGRHCTVPGCTMRQSPTLQKLLEHAREEDPVNCLCELCREDLERFRKANY